MPKCALEAVKPKPFTLPVDLREIARVHIEAALDNLKNGFLPEAKSELYFAANSLQAYLDKTKHQSQCTSEH